MIRLLALTLILTGIGFWYWRQFLRPFPLPPPPRTVSQVLRVLGPKTDARLAPLFRAAGVSYPPGQLTLIAFKSEKRLDVFASSSSRNAVSPGPPKLIFSRPILGASGNVGPKLREGDLQVPEGFYRLELLNPNSRFHLSLRVNYPNEEDILHAREEGRPLETLGGDIMIHGGSGSTGCLAMGDAAVEELFVLAARTGLDAIQLLIVPRDFRTNRTGPELPATAPVWTLSRYAALRDALEDFPLPVSPRNPKSQIRNR